MLITPEYLAQQQRLHDNPHYGRGGHRWSDYVIQMYDGRGTVLDYGCGKGTLKLALKGMVPMLEYDPAVPGKDACTGCRWLVCTDVLEHIEPECLDDVLAHIGQKFDYKALLVACTRPAKKVLPDGRNAHLIIEDKEWWLDKLSEFFDVTEIYENPSQDGEVAFIVQHRK